ncbi:MAG: conserved phage C-terminal domain-containing protein [Coprobacillus sp.]
MNYISILDFMVSDLKLRGNELIVYALIYGFTQDEISDFHGSLTYIQERTGLSRPTVTDILKKLQERNYIIKEEQFRNNIKYCSYKCSKETLLGVVKFLSKGSKETLPNNKDILNINNNSRVNEIVSEVILYLNKKTNKHFRLEAKTNREPISARLNDGYTIKDLKYVIDTKTKEWLNTPMDEYLCPQTLFRPGNFEKYINKKQSIGKDKGIDWGD